MIEDKQDGGHNHHLVGGEGASIADNRSGSVVRGVKLVRKKAKMAIIL